MLCPNCQQDFNATCNIPRILIFCGHTYCHQCIESLLIQSTDDNQNEISPPKNCLSCPECGTQNIAADGVNSFPKNLVLLQVNPQQTQQTLLKKQQSASEQQKPKENQSKPQDATKAICNLHQKKLEAFCEKDLQVLCIDCILSEQHKSHEIISVQKAVEKQKQTLYEEVTNAQKTEEKLRFIQSDIKRHINDMHSQAERNRKELSSIYSYIREIILEREQLLKRQISESLVREEQENNCRLSEIADFMSQINSLKSELLCQNSESEIDILLRAKSRSQLSTDVNGPRSRELISFNLLTIVQTCQSLTEIKREQELMQISKIINPTYKGPTAGQSFGQNGLASSLYQHTQSTASKMKKQNTIGINQVSSSGVYPQNAISNMLPQSLAEKNSAKDDIRKNKQLAQQQVKAKVSPHRASKKQDQIVTQISNKKQGVVVLDQNKQKSLNQKQSKAPGNYGGIVQNNINLYNYNNHNQSTQNQNNCDENSEDVIGTMGGDDVSSIYPLETHDYYFQENVINMPNYKNGFIKRDESVGALNDLLDSLNKSALQDNNQVELEVKADNSTASETGGSHSEIKTPPQQELRQKQKGNAETPKQKKNNPWKAGNTNNLNQIQQQSKSNKKTLKKDNSTTDIDEIKHRLNLKSNTKENSYFQAYYEEQKEEKPQRAGSLNAKYNSNSAGLIQSKQIEDDIQIPRQRESNNNNQQVLASLSQERTKRKQQKLLAMPGSSVEQSPFKLQRVIEQMGEQNQIKDLVQECAQSIEKLEFRAKISQAKVSDLIESPIKLKSANSSKAAVCVVDLTKKEDFEQPQQVRSLSLLEEKDTIKVDEEEEGDHQKQIPNITNQKDSSPFKNKKEGSHSKQFINACSYQSSPQKINSFMQSQESLDNIQQLTRKSENSLDHSKNAFSLAQNEIMLQNSASIDTSVSDPFRALCRVKEEFIFVFSGFNDSKLLNCEALDIQRGTWKEIATIGKARTKFSAVPISKSRILIFGGKQSDGQRTGEIEEYNLKTNKFKTLPFKLPKPRSGFAACVKREEGKIFFCGGNSGSVLKKFDCLDLKKGKWSRWPEMLQKRDELAVALGPDGKIYAIGGYGGSSSYNNNNGNQGENQEIQDKQAASSNCLRTAERFDFNTGQWELLPEMNEARRALAAVALPDGIYAIGGYDGKQYLSTVEKFDLQKQQWISVKSMNTSRCTLSAVVSNDCQYIYALGGFNGNSLDLVERYNTMNDEWEFVTPMISKRFMHEAVCLITH